ncbi:MAG: right-handed parallel beta-helix repeat-containing protein [bacterium]|nr:right-handed parallel beta-helix repeat-containing protein [bacterium]
MHDRAHVRRLSTAWLIALFLLAATAWAEEGRIPLFEPTVIDTPGSYVLTRDITGTFPVLDIVAAAENVEIDLNGFNISLAAASSSNVMRVSGLTRFVIRNGTIERPVGSSLIFGLFMENTKQVIIEDITFNTAWITGENVEAFLVRRNVWPLEDGVKFAELGSPTVPMTGSIEENMLANGNIIVQSAAGNSGVSARVVNNRITGGGFWGIYLSRQSGCVIEGNRVSDQDGTGISLSTVNDCLIVGNVVRNSGASGIYLSSSTGNRLLNNVSNENGGSMDPFLGSGIHLAASGRNYLEGNTTVGNLKAGIHLDINSSGNVYSRNMARVNAASPGGAGCTNPAITTCPAPYGTGSAAPDLCDNGIGNSTMCDNMMPGPPRS